MYGAYVEVAAYSQTWDRKSNEDKVSNEILTWLAPETSQWFNIISKANSSSDIPSEDFMLICEVSEIEGPKPLYTIPQQISNSIDTANLAEKLMSVDYHSSNRGPFAHSSDTQVILSNVVDGLHAFADYFVLYDISARGFVRPLCVSYFSTDKKKLMDYFYLIRTRFVEISRYLKYGNRRLFLLELELYLEDLQIAKDNYVKSCRVAEQEAAKEKSEDVQDSSMINHFANSIIETQHLLNTERPLLEDTTSASLFWKVENKIKTFYNHDLYQYIQTFVLIDPMHSPKLESLKTDTGMLEMRNVFELCSWGFVIGLDMMISLHKYFNRDSVVIYMENEDFKYLEPEHGKLHIGNHVIANVGITFDINSCDSPLALSFGEDLVNIDRNYAELLSFFKMMTPHKSSCTGSITNFISETDSNSSCDEVYDDAIDDPTFVQPTTNSHFGKTATLGYLTCNASKQDVRALQFSSLANYIEQLTAEKPGYGIAAIFSQYSCFPHLLFSLLIRRPVIIMGTSSNEDLVRSAVQALAMFVPEKQRAKSVLPWCTQDIMSKEVNKIALVGLCINNHESEKNILQSVVSKQLSLINVTKHIYEGPQYTGNALSSLLRIKKQGWDDSTFILYLQSLLFTIASYVYIYHQSMALTKLIYGKKCDISTQKKTNKALLHALSINKDDGEIVRCFTELLI